MRGLQTALLKFNVSTTFLYPLASRLSFALDHPERNVNFSVSCEKRNANWYAYVIVTCGMNDVNKRRRAKSPKRNSTIRQIIETLESLFLNTLVFPQSRISIWECLLRFPKTKKKEGMPSNLITDGLHFRFIFNYDRTFVTPSFPYNNSSIYLI